MAYFPFFVDLKDKKCLVVGGGEVALRKTAALLEFEAEVHVIAPIISDKICCLGDMVILYRRQYQEADLKGALCVIAATDDAGLNRMIFEQCTDRGILVNVVDVCDQCGFFFPAYLRQGPVTVGVTTSGSSPMLAGRIKKQIAQALPDYSQTARTLGKYREYVKKNVPEQTQRNAIIREMTQFAVDENKTLTDEAVRTIINRYTGKEQGQDEENRSDRNQKEPVGADTVQYNHGTDTQSRT